MGSFIDHQEVLDTLEHAKKNKSNYELISQIIAKAKECKGLTHREAAVLLECDSQEHNHQIEELAKHIKEKFYGKRIVMFAPLYLSNYCVNGCIYCPFHLKNKNIARKKLSQEEIRSEVLALQDMGHKRLALEAGEDPGSNPIEYILESIDTIYKSADIRRVNVNIAATSVENYRKLRDAGIGTYILFQETYHRETYEKLHPSGPKHDYDYHSYSMDRAMEGGIDDVGIGVLFGLYSPAYDLTGLLMHAEHLEEVFGVGPHTISVPRVLPSNDVGDEAFAKIVAIIRIAVPYTGMIISTRENMQMREKILALGVSQISGGSRTSVGGYSSSLEDSSAQFEVMDTRTLDEIVNWLLNLGYMPSFCTACYDQGRTGDKFMSMVKSGKIADHCNANALATLKEYLRDYASAETRETAHRYFRKGK